MNRRSFIAGLFAAPAIVAFASLMPVRGVIMAVPFRRHKLTPEEIAQLAIERQERHFMRHGANEFRDAFSNNWREVYQRLPSFEEKRLSTPIDSGWRSFFSRPLVVDYEPYGRTTA